MAARPANALTALTNVVSNLASDPGCNGFRYGIGEIRPGGAAPPDSNMQREVKALQNLTESRQL